MKLRKKKRLIALFNDFEIDAVLHGHLHHSQQYERGRLQFVNSGGAIKGLNTNKLKFHLVTFAKSKVNIDLKTIPKEFFKEQSKVEFQLNSVNQIEKMLQVN
jgi:predicted phosphodiesterase